jgi:transaldolase/glucose-6-phosphate isomerase
MNVSVEYRRRGHAVWLDSISARMISSGRLAGLVSAGTVYGVTSNPTIFGQAIAKDAESYDAPLRRLSQAGADAFAVYDELTRKDIAGAADVFREAHVKSPEDGWISLEVLPSLATDTEKTVSEAVRLSSALGRPNVFIKVPATGAGIPAIRRLIGQGVSVNVTLMFNRRHYEAVANAYIEGLEELAKGGGDLSKVYSVASFFVSRVDTAVDKALEEKAGRASGAEKERLLSLRGRAGLANSKVVYQDFLRTFEGAPRFAALAAKGARVQRPLWASTGTKNPAYSDLLYVENLVGPHTVNTMPEKTLDALLDHGKCAGDTVLEGVDACRKDLDDLRALGIDVEDVGEQLQVDGVALFERSYDELLSTIEDRRALAASVHATKKISTLP